MYPGPELIEAHDDLRVACAHAGHALADRAHGADRWIAATAIRLGVPLVTHDGIFRDAPGVDVVTQLPT